MLAHVAAEPVFLLFPTAPPRVLDGFVDTLSEVSGVDIEHPFLVRFYNPIAAMPSLHVAFAVLTGAAIAERTESALVKGAAYAYAPLVALVVAGTGNHYVADAVAGAALGAAARKRRVTVAPESTRGRRPQIPPGWKAGVVVVVALLVAVGVGTLIAKAAGFSRVRDAIEEAESTWFLVCFFAEVAAFAAYAVVVREALHWRGGPRVRYGLSVHVTLASLGATRVVAAAGAGGLAVTYWCFRRARFATREALVRVLGLNTLVYLVVRGRCVDRSAPRGARGPRARRRSP